jgi:hypothetical protein
MSDVHKTKALGDPIVFLICFATWDISGRASGVTVRQPLQVEPKRQTLFVSCDGLKQGVYHRVCIN